MTIAIINVYFAMFKSVLKGNSRSKSILNISSFFFRITCQVPSCYPLIERQALKCPTVHLSLSVLSYPPYGHNHPHFQPRSEPSRSPISLTRIQRSRSTPHPIRRPARSPPFAANSPPPSFSPRANFYCSHQSSRAREKRAAEVAVKKGGGGGKKSSSRASETARAASAFAFRTERGRGKEQTDRGTKGKKKSTVFSWWSPPHPPNPSCPPPPGPRSHTSPSPTPPAALHGQVAAAQADPRVLHHQGLRQTHQA
jgi:hypothetical protein